MKKILLIVLIFLADKAIAQVEGVIENAKTQDKVKESEESEKKRRFHKAKVRLPFSA